MSNNHKKSFVSSIKSNLGNSHNSVAAAHDEKLKTPTSDSSLDHELSGDEMMEDNETLADNLEETGLSAEKIAEIKSKIYELKENNIFAQNELSKSKIYAEKLEEIVKRMRSEQATTLRVHEDEVKNAKNFSISNFVSDLLEPLENMYRARLFLEQLDENLAKQAKNVFEGINITLRSFENVFQKHGIQRIFPVAGGDLFDHNLHQAVSQVSNDDLPENTVLEVLQAGYTLKTRLLRPAMVIVSIKS